jgi:type III pantothenate kinase
MKCFYDKRAVGMDRLVGAYAARILFPHTRLILDFGTAITLDFLSRQGAYRGGIILPGIGSTLGVYARCALLPRYIRFKKTKKHIPANTRESITKGLQEGFSLMINSLVAKYKGILHIPKASPVIITGGDAALIMPHFDFAYYYEELLVIKGLLALARKHELL